MPSKLSGLTGRLRRQLLTKRPGLSPIDRFPHSDNGREMARSISDKLMSAVNALLHPTFYSIRLRASGMLSPKVYAKIYEEATSASDFDILEIGAGRGAATIVLAKAMIESGKSSKLVAVEKFAGGSNVDFGSRDENLEAIVKLFDHYNVRDRIALFPEYLDQENMEELKRLIDGDRLGLLLIDADGRLDIHLPMLWSHLRRGTPIVLDDYSENYQFAVKSEKFPLGRTKELLCFRLVNRMAELGYIDIDEVLMRTVFARRGAPESFSEGDLEQLYREVLSVERDYDAWLEAQAIAS